MIKIVIADDEVVIRKGLEKLIAWDDFGIQIAGSYKDGNEAFQGIVSLQPEIALLDIHMPGKNGIQVLKEIREMGIHTKVIFISGYQHFQYAKDALTYGAIGYLLKPVIWKELIYTIEKCTSLIRNEKWMIREPLEDAFAVKENYDDVVFLDKPPYVLAVIHIFSMEKQDTTTEKIIFFAIFNFLKDFMKKNHAGITFEKSRKIILIFKESTVQEVKALLFETLWEMKCLLGYSAGAVVGQSVRQLTEIGFCYSECLDKLGYFYFLDSEKTPIILAEETVFPRVIQSDEFVECKEQLINCMISLYLEQYEKQMGRFKKIVCIKADGKKDDAYFYACDLIQTLELAMDSLGKHDFHPEIKEILTLFRETKKFSEMIERLDSYLQMGIRQIQLLAVNQGQKSIQSTKEYIKKHYQENITLEILAGQVYMNPYYFSKYFKKHAGVNYKDYLDHVRLEAAKKLLDTTGMSSKDISVEAGFADVRTFTKLLKKETGETPVKYRNRRKISIQEHENEGKKSKWD